MNRHSASEYIAHEPDWRQQAPAAAAGAKLVRLMTSLVLLPAASRRLHSNPEGPPVVEKRLKSELQPSPQGPLVWD